MVNSPLGYNMENTIIIYYSVYLPAFTLLGKKVFFEKKTFKKSYVSGWNLCRHCKFNLKGGETVYILSLHNFIDVRASHLGKRHVTPWCACAVEFFMAFPTGDTKRNCAVSTKKKHIWQFLREIWWNLNRKVEIPISKLVSLPFNSKCQLVTNRIISLICFFM